MTTQAPGMSDQIAAQSVIEQLLRLQQSVPSRSAFARFWGYSPLGADSVAWYRGAQGEIEVGRILSRLPSELRVFHALPVGTAGADIDHLVLGPSGIFTINTKHHRGKKIWVAGGSFQINGQTQAYLRNSKFEATRVTKMLQKRMPQEEARRSQRFGRELLAALAAETARGSCRSRNCRARGDRRCAGHLADAPVDNHPELDGPICGV